MKKNRDHVKEYFLDWSEGQLDEEKMRTVEHHLEVCESCATYYQTMHAVMEEPKTDQLPSLQKDPYLPVRIRSLAKGEQGEYESKRLPLFGLSKSWTGALVLVGLLFGFIIGQQLVYIADEEQTPAEEISVAELYYQGMAQPNLGSQLGKVLTEIEGDQQ